MANQPDNCLPERVLASLRQLPADVLAKLPPLHTIERFVPKDEEITHVTVAMYDAWVENARQFWAEEFNDDPATKIATWIASGMALSLSRNARYINKGPYRLTTPADLLNECTRRGVVTLEVPAEIMTIDAHAARAAAIVAFKIASQE